MQPGNPIVGGTVLRYPAIQSPNYVAGSTGWIINEDGTAEFNSLSIHGSIVIGSGSNNVIILDFARRAIFIYDNSANLVGSFAPLPGTDSFGNLYQAGFASYLPAHVNAYISMFSDVLSISQNDTSQATAFTLGPSASGKAGPGADQPVIDMIGSTDFSADTALLQLFGANPGGTAHAFLRARNGNSVSPLDLLVQGIVKWSATGSTNYAETWHALPLSTNWINQGAPFGNGSYRRMPDGTVRLTGAIAWTAAAANAPVQVCTALPADYRPLSQKRCMTMSMGVNTAPPTVESFDIHTDGTVWITSFANGTGPLTPITLDNVSYPIDG